MNHFMVHLKINIITSSQPVHWPAFTSFCNIYDLRRSTSHRETATLDIVAMATGQRVHQP